MSRIIFSYKELKKYGIDILKTRSINYSNKNKDRIIEILKNSPYTRLIILKGYNVYQEPQYSLDLFVEYCDSFLRPRQKDYLKDLLKLYNTIELSFGIVSIPIQIGNIKKDVFARHVGYSASKITIIGEGDYAYVYTINGYREHYKVLKKDFQILEVLKEYDTQDL